MKTPNIDVEVFTTKVPLRGSGAQDPAMAGRLIAINAMFHGDMDFQNGSEWNVHVITQDHSFGAKKSGQNFGAGHEF